MRNSSESRSSDTSTSGGSSDSEQNALTVVPCGRSPSKLVTTATGAATDASASRKTTGSTPGRSLGVPTALS